MVEQYDRPGDSNQYSGDIETSRARMRRTVEALESRLSPDRLKTEAKQRIRQETVGRVETFTNDVSENVKGVSADVFETIKRNPFPAALAAVGLGWLFMERRNDNRMRSQGGYGYDEQGYYTPGYGRQGSRMYSQADRYGYEGRSASDRMRGAAGGLQDKAGQVADQAQAKASQVAGQVQDTASQVAGQVQDTASQVAGQVQETASQVADQVQYRAGQAATRFEQMLDENPLLVGAAALAIGAAVGFSLPGTQKENEMLGHTRDQVMEKVQSAAGETLDKAQQVAQSAGNAAKEAAKSEAQNQHLPTSSS